VPVAEPQSLAVVALQPLSANQPVAETAVALKPLAVVPNRYYTSIEDVVGRVPLLDIDAGAPITPRYFKDANVLARLIPEGHRALSLEISDVVAVGGFVRPGDRVDLLVHLRDTQQLAQSRILLDDVLVLAYEERIIERPQGVDDPSARTQRGRVRTAVVAVPETLVTRVMLGASVGDVRLALRRQQADLAELEGNVPLTTPTPAPDFDVEQAVTLTELTKVKKPTPTPKPGPAPFKVEVFRADQASQEGGR
jgi:pilus assembly protein CpaB